MRDISPTYPTWHLMAVFYISALESHIPRTSNNKVATIIEFQVLEYWAGKSRPMKYFTQYSNILLRSVEQVSVLQGNFDNNSKLRPWSPQHNSTQIDSIWLRWNFRRKWICSVDTATIFTVIYLKINS